MQRPFFPRASSRLWAPLMAVASLCLLAHAPSAYALDRNGRNFFPNPFSQKNPKAKTQPPIADGVALPPKTPSCYYDADVLHVIYDEEGPGPLPLDILYGLTFELGETHEGFVASEEGEEVRRLTLEDLGPLAIPFHANALSSIAKQMVGYFNARGYVGVYVQVDPRQITPKGEDLRPEENREISFRVSCSHVNRVNTVARRQRETQGQSVNASCHQRLARQFPLRGCDEEGRWTEDSYLNLDRMNAYLYRVNRYPGRSVNAELDGMPGDGGVDLSLIVNEEKPWHVYFNAATVGNTQTTDLWIERIGFIDYQLTHHDDTLALEYATSGFSSLHSLVGSYEAPWYHCDRLRWRLDGSYSTFNLQAADLYDDEVGSKQWRAGPSLIVNFFQHKDFFADLQFGAYWLNIEANNTFYDVEVRNQFLLPTLTLACELKRPERSVQAAVSVQHNLQHLANTNTATLDSLGRLQASPNWWLMEFNFQGSAYLPTDCCDRALGRVLSPHEVWALVGGQYAFNYRLIPQKEGVIGGMFTVRGYPNGASSGDSVVYMQAEYRYHFRSYCLQEGGEGCATSVLRPSQWMLRLFFDAGNAVYNRRIAGEENSYLAGFGIGGEYTYKKNLVLRLDVATPMKDDPSSGTKNGTGRVYASVSWLF